MEHYCYTIQGWFPYAFLYSHIVTQCLTDLEYTFVEVGSWKGSSSTYMGVEIINSGKNIKFFCVDTWKGSDEHKDKTNNSYEPLLETENGLYDEFIKNITPVKSVITPIRLTSIEASKLFDDESIDFIMIDAAHDYDNVKNDILHWYPKMKKGGIMSGDDICWPGVAQAVTEIFEKDYINHNDIIWIHKKY